MESLKSPFDVFFICQIRGASLEVVAVFREMEHARLWIEEQGVPNRKRYVVIQGKTLLD